MIAGAVQFCKSLSFINFLVFLQIRESASTRRTAALS